MAELAGTGTRDGSGTKCDAVAVNQGLLWVSAECAEHAERSFGSGQSQVGAERSPARHLCGIQAKAGTSALVDDAVPAGSDGRAEWTKADTVQGARSQPLDVHSPFSRRLQEKFPAWVLQHQMERRKFQFSHFPLNSFVIPGSPCDVSRPLVPIDGGSLVNWEYLGKSSALFVGQQRLAFLCRVTVVYVSAVK